MSIRARLLVIVSVATLLPVIFVCARFFQDREEQLHNVIQTLPVAARTIAANLDEKIQGTEQLHFGLAQARDLNVPDKAACSDFLSKVLIKHPQYTGILTVDPDGSLFCDSLQSGRTLDLRDRGYFQRALVTMDSVALEPVFGRLTGTSVLQIAYPVRDDSQELKFVLLASLNLEQFAGVHAASLPGGTELLFVDNTGTVLAWSPRELRANHVGTSLADSGLSRFAAENPGGATQEITGIDGVSQVWSLADSSAIHDAGIRILVGRSKNDLAAAPNQRLWEELALLAGLSPLLFMGVWLLAKFGIHLPIGRIAAMADRLGTGDFSARIPPPYPRGELGGLMAVLNSTATSLAVQQRERLEAEADRAQRLASEREAQVKDELVSSVSHELRTPLASIIGFAELLLTREFPEADRREFLATILHEGQRLAALINDFLDLQRIESGQMEVTPRAADLRPLLERAVASVGADAERPIVLDVSDGLPLVLADPDRVQQVLLNLFSNARKYSPTGGEIRLGARATGEGTVEVAVQDQGLGLPPEALPRLFERFYRVDSSDRREISGTGLGLAICKDLVEAQGGQMRVESAGVGLGSTFAFTLPVAEMTEGSSAAPSGAERMGAMAVGGQRLLVIENDPAVGRWLAETLATEGYAVQVATTGEEGLAAVAAARPSAVLLNISLGGQLDGWDLLAVLRGRVETASVPVVVISGREELARGRALGVADYLVKPVSLETLRKAVRRLGVARGQLVLVAEDDAATLRATLTALEGAGFRAEGVPTGEAALARLQASPDGYGLLLLDLGLPGIDGFAVLEAVRAQPATTALPVLVYTGRDLSADERLYLNGQAVEVLRKGDDMGIPVVEAVARALAHRGAEPGDPPARNPEEGQGA